MTFFHQITEIQKVSSWRDWTSGYCAEKNWIRKIWETRKEIEQELFCKKGWTNEEVFFTKKGNWRRFKQSFAKKNRKNTNRRNIRESKKHKESKRKETCKEKNGEIENRKSNDKESEQRVRTQKNENKLRRKSKEKSWKESHILGGEVFGTEAKRLKQQKQDFFNKDVSSFRLNVT